MKVYLISTSAGTSEGIKPSYKNFAHSESCIYTENIQTAFLENPESHGWAKETVERLERGSNIRKEFHVSVGGEMVEWTKFDYEGLRWYYNLENGMCYVPNLFDIFGGNLILHKAEKVNSDKSLLEERDSLLGFPQVAPESVILEIVDDNLEESLRKIGIGFERVSRENDDKSGFNAGQRFRIGLDSKDE